MHSVLNSLESTKKIPIPTSPTPPITAKTKSRLMMFFSIGRKRVSIRLVLMTKMMGISIGETNLLNTSFRFIFKKVEAIWI